MSIWRPPEFCQILYGRSSPWRATSETLRNMYQFNSCVVLSRILYPLHPWYLQESYTVKSNPNSPVNFCEVLLWLLDTQEWCGHQMRNESENCGHGRESNPTSSAIAAAALTSELQAIPMAYWHNCSSNLSLFSKFLNLMTILSYFIPWIFTFLINHSIGISPTYENWQPAKIITNFWCWSSPCWTTYGSIRKHTSIYVILLW